MESIYIAENTDVLLMPQQIKIARVDGLSYEMAKKNTELIADLLNKHYQLGKYKGEK